MAVQMEQQDFESLVDRAIEGVPRRFLDLLDNCAIVIEDEPPEDQPELLGLYEGVPLTERGDYAGALPDTITIFRGPTLRACDTAEDVRHEVQVTVVHEIAHFFGIDDATLGRLGWA